VTRDPSNRDSCSSCTVWVQVFALLGKFESQCATGAKPRGRSAQRRTANINRLYGLRRSCLAGLRVFEIRLTVSNIPGDHPPGVEALEDRGSVRKQRLCLASVEAIVKHDVKHRHLTFAAASERRACLATQSHREPLGRLGDKASESGLGQGRSDSERVERKETYLIIFPLYWRPSNANRHCVPSVHGIVAASATTNRPG